MNREEDRILGFDAFRRRSTTTSPELDPTISTAIYDEPAEWADWDEARQIARVQELSSGSLHNAIERGKLLRRMELQDADYEIKRIGITSRTGHKLINLASSPRTYLDWSKPTWAATHELVKYDAREAGQRDDRAIHEYRYAVSDAIFRKLTDPDANGNRLVNYETTHKQVLQAIHAHRVRNVIPKPNSADKALVNKVVCGDAVEVLRTMADQSVHCCITSPPYLGVRDFGVEGQIGLEESPVEYIARLVDVFHEVKRVLRDDGTLWVNIGDAWAGSGKGRNADGSHAPGGLQSTNRGSVDGVLHKVKLSNDLKTKDLIGLPWMLAFALRADCWYLRSEIIWHKICGFPESVQDRPTRAHEHIFLLSKSENYYYAIDQIREKTGNEMSWEEYNKRGSVQRREIDDLRSGIPGGGSSHPLGRNKRSVWQFRPARNETTHTAVFPPELPKICMLAGCPVGGIVLDPFAGSGTTGIVALKNQRKFIGIELNPEYVKMANERIQPTRQREAVTGSG